MYSLILYIILDMTYSATLTGKQQLTVPIELFRRLNWEIGQKVLISENNGSLSITSALDLVDQLAGSVPIPQRFKGLSTQQIIEMAIRENHTK